jgi:hypothetical protein
VGEHLEVEIRQRHHRSDVVLLAQGPEGRDVARIIDPRHRHAVISRVLSGRQRVRIGGDRGRVLPERGHDVVALPDSGEEYGYVALGGCHPPDSPL